MTTVHMIATFLAAGAAYMLGGGSLVAFTLFLFFGSFNLVDLGLGQGRALLVDTCLSLLFFLQHSGMIRSHFRHALARMVPEQCCAALYAMASGVTLCAVLIFWQEGTLLYAVPPGSIRLLLRGLFLLAIAGFFWSGMSLQQFDPFGVRRLLGRLEAPVVQPSLTIAGPYRLVRHPLYLLSIVLIWSCPDLTTDRLLFNLLWTGWIVIGTFLEERDLLEEFGDAYRAYRKRVPMFIPGIHRRKR